MPDPSGLPHSSARRPTAFPPVLALPRRRGGTRSPFELSAASIEARKQIADIVSVTRTPFGEAKPIDPNQAGMLERSLRELEARLEEREQGLEELESRLAERERDIAEAEALIAARNQLLEVARRATPAKTGGSKEELAGLEQLKSALDRQEITLKEQKGALIEREQFIEQNEAKLFEKMMLQQEKETELEQKDEDLRVRERQLESREAVLDPSSRGGFQGKTAELPRKFDEFNE